MIAEIATDGVILILIFTIVCGGLLFLLLRKAGKEDDRDHDSN